MAKIIIDGQAVGLTAGSGGSDITFDDTLTTNDEGVTSVTNPMRGILTQAEYDALPEAEKNKGTYVISDGDGSGGVASGGGSSNEVYSTEETRIGTWFNGKPLYRKVIQTTSPSAVNTTENIYSLNSDMVIQHIGGYLIGSANEDRYPIPWCCTSDRYIYAHYSNYQKIPRISMGVSHSMDVNRPVLLILEYTKTTDTATN